MEVSMVESSHTAGRWPALYEPFRNFGQRVADWVAPRSDASVGEDAYEINIELPGVNPEDVDVSVHQNLLKVKGEKKSEREETGKDFFFSEREFGSFERSFRLPSDADPAKIEATFTDGVLKLRVARVVEKEPEATKVKIKRG
jgi:HSP20 family protein